MCEGQFGVEEFPHDYNIFAARCLHLMSCLLKVYYTNNPMLPFPRLVILKEWERLYPCFKMIVLFWVLFIKVYYLTAVHCFQPKLLYNANVSFFSSLGNGEEELHSSCGR